MTNEGKIIRIISNLYTVVAHDKRYECRARGKFRNDKVTPLVGDLVVFDAEKGIIEEIKTRKNELKRPPIANVDAALIITSVKKPDLSLSLLDKQLLCVLNEGIEPIIVLTKCDLLSKEESRDIKAIVKDYKKAGFKVITNKNIFRLKCLIKNKTLVLTGQTGAGKSTLLNKLDKRLNLKTNPISEALGRGVHTTRHTELFEIGKTLIADTPGFSALDVLIDKDKIKDLYPEFKGCSCKFDNCMHINEKNCGVKEKLANGEIRQSRYDNYVKFRSEL